MDVVGKEAAEELIAALESGGCVDEWLQDQIVIFMALSEGESAVRTGSLTLHTRSIDSISTAAPVLTGLCSFTGRQYGSLSR